MLKADGSDYYGVVRNFTNELIFVLFLFAVAKQFSTIHYYYYIFLFSKESRYLLKRGIEDTFHSVTFILKRLADVGNDYSRS